MMLAITAELGYEVLMLDVQAAFLNADVEEEVYVNMAPRYETYGKSGVLLTLYEDGILLLGNN